MKLFFTLCFILLSVTTSVAGPIDSIFALKSEDERVKGFIELAEHQFNVLTGAEVHLFLDDAENKCKKYSHDKLRQEIWYYRQIQTAREVGNKSPMEVMQPLFHAVKTSREKNWKYIEARLRTNIGIFLIGREFTELAFEHFVNACRLIDEVGLDKYPEAILMLAKIAEQYYHFGDYDNAIRWMKMSMTVRDPWKLTSTTHENINTLALCYQARMQYDSAVHFFRMAHERAVAIGNTFWTSLTNGNIGFCLYQNGNLDEALQRLLPDFELSIQHNEKVSALNAALAISGIYVQQKKYDAAEPYLEFARENIGNMNAKSKASYYKALAEISKFKGQWTSACHQMDSFLLYKKISDDITDSRFIKNAEIKVNIERHAHELTLLEEKKSKQILIRNGLLVILLMAGIITGLMFNRGQLQRKKELEQAEWDKKLALSQLEKAEHELNNFTRSLREKNDLIQAIRQEIQSLKSSALPDERVHNLNQLLHSSILTDDEWKQFRQLFEKVYPGFLFQLKDKYPQLSPSETRLIVLAKLDVTQKEMAEMLGVGYDAIRKTKQRLRSKLNLRPEDNLEEILNAL